MMTLDHAWDSLMTMTLQSVVVCLFAGAGVLLLRKAAAASRHLLLVLSVTSLLSVPLLALFLPHWQVPLYGQASDLALYTAERAAIQARDAARSPGRDTRLQRPEASAPVASAGGATLHSSVQEPLSARARQIPLSSTVPSTAGVHTMRDSVWQTADCRQVVLAVWLLGAVIALLRLVAGLIGTWRVTARETASDPVLSHAVMQLQSELGMERAVTVRQTRVGSALPVPLTWGLFHPTVLLPPAFLEWPQDRRRMVLLHELAHIQRADWLVQVLVQVSRALYWFHPLVWWTTLRLQAESERACDDMVLLTGVAPSAYAETLLEVIRTMNRSKKSILSPASLLSMARPPIEARLRAILSPQQRTRPSRSILLLAFAGSAICVIALASIQVQANRKVTLARAQIEALKEEANSHSISSMSASKALDAGPQALTLAAMQGSAKTLPAKARKSTQEEDAAVLRQRLDALEQLLMQNQQENARLRQQLRALEAQQNAAGAMSRQAADAAAAMSKQATATAMSKQAAAAADQYAATRTILRDLQRQQELLKTQAAQADALYRNGMTTYKDAIRKKADVDINRARIDALETQLKELKAGHQSSVKEQLMAQLREYLAEQKAELAVEQEGLKIAQERFKAGVANNSEVVEAELKVSRTQAEIDKLNAQILQATAR